MNLSFFRPVLTGFVLGFLLTTIAQASETPNAPAAEQKKEEAKKDEPKKEEPKKEEPKKEEPKKEDSKADTVELKKEPLRLTVRLTGTFESKQAATVRLKGEEFTAFEVLNAVKHGASVRKGEVLIRFNEQKYNEAFADRKRALRLSEIALKEEEIALRYLETRQPITRETQDRQKREADEDLAYFFNTEQNWTKRQIDMMLKRSDFSLESAKEELKQLEKMYKADDLVEETEEFILKRTKFMVEMQDFFNEMMREDMSRMKGTLLPRMETTTKTTAKLADLDFRKSKETFGFVLEQAKLKLEKSTETHKKLVESYNKFVADKQMLQLRSPADGVVYYGEYSGETSKGKWSGAAQLAGGLKVKDTVKNDQVLFTIVDPTASLMRATVTEKDLRWVHPGVSGKVQPTAFPNIRLNAKVAEINGYPSPANDFVTLLSVEVPGGTKIYPNMTGSVDLTVYDKKDSILVPTTALKREELEDDSWSHAYAFVLCKGGTTSKVKVRLGEVKGDKTEVLGGISEGAKVYKKADDGEKAIEKAKEEKEKKEKEAKEAAEKAEKERKEKETAEKAAKEKAEKERQEKEAAEKAAKEKAEKERQEKEAAK